MSAAAAALVILMASPAHAQIVLYVTGQPITAYDIEQRSKLIALTSGGKSKSRQEVINELIVQTRQRRPVTGIVVTHDMKTARKVADRTVMLYPLSRLKEDERQVNVFMTPEGRKLLEESQCLGDTLVERSKMTAEDVQGLNRRMQTFLAAVNEEV